MSDPSEALQRAIYAQLRAHAPLAALIGNPPRVYDRVPAGEKGKPVFPYLTISDAQVLDDSTDCTVASECFMDVHVWSRAVGTIEAKRIGAAVHAALHGAVLDLGANYYLHLMEHNSTRHLSDPDGITSHSVLTFRALIENT